jgi:2-polyprenyl-3-methyl-5-hydroxy-6-metoxy-1,4-benzoquinol methylase
VNAASDAATAARIAARYRRWRHRRYVRGKLLWDPLFAAAAPLFAGSTRPLLDIGCGLGLLGQYLRETGFRAPYSGIDPDDAKIEEARAAAAAGALDVAFAIGSAASLPAFRGDVVLIDVLHYMPVDAQRQAIALAAARVEPDGVLVIRNVLRAASWRFPTGHYPRREDIEAPLRAIGFDVSVAPLWGRTPFNSWLFVARRRRDT